MSLPIFIDIDGTLTHSQTGDPNREKQNGKPNFEMIEKVKNLINRKVEVVVWSGGGTKYAKDFCEKHEIYPLAVIGKPRICVDDNPTIRPKERIKILSPKDFLAGGL